MTVITISNNDGQSPPDSDFIEPDAALPPMGSNFWLLTDAMPQMVWSTLPDGYHDYFNARWYEFTGVPHGSTDGEAWAGIVHEEDEPRTWETWRHSLATGEPYEVEYRLRHRSGEYRWAIGRAVPIRDGGGKIVRWIGTCTDFDRAKKQAEQNELLSHELSHRIKNIFAVVGGLIGLSARDHPGAADYARELRQRIAALGWAHEFVRPHSEYSAPMVGDTGLQPMLNDLLAAYPAMAQGRLTIMGDNPRIDDRSATPIALTFHELATNSAKYGALASPTGSVAIEATEIGDALSIEWREAGGPPVLQAPARHGFGTRLVDLSIEQQLDGKIERAWNSSGLIVAITIPIRNLTRVPLV